MERLSSYLGQQLEPYFTPILYAFLAFIPVAAVFTLPFMIVQYRRYGGIAMMRTIVVYAFILYMMSAFFLTMLPLPSREAVLALPERGIQWIPFYDLYHALSEAGLALEQPATLLNGEYWKAFFTSRGLFQILANIVMQMPLGFFLRYYFRRTWKQTIIIGMLVSIFYELTQLSGLFFIYPKPYRFCSIDDVINNTLGALIGYWCAPLLTSLLPSRDMIDRISYEKGRSATIPRRVVAAVIDWGIFILVWNVLLFVHKESNSMLVLWGTSGYFVWVIVVFVLLQRVAKGRTIGKALLRIAVVRENENRAPKLRQLFIRYALIYFVAIPLIPVWLLMFLVALGADGLFPFRVVLFAVCGVILLIVLYAIFRSLQRWNQFPHTHLSHSRITVCGKSHYGRQIEPGP